MIMTSRRSGAVSDPVVFAVVQKTTTVGRTKCEQVNDILDDSRLCKGVGAAWRLFMHLVFKCEGRVVNTYENLGKTLRVPAKTVRNWVSTLVKAGAVTQAKRGHQIEVVLTGKCMDAANAPDHRTEEVKTLVVDPRLLAINSALNEFKEKDAPVEFQWTMSGKN